MDQLLASLRAAAEPTRLRLLALAARGAFCVMEFTEILGQSQPRLSRHLKLLVECGLLNRVREGTNVWFALPTGADGDLARDLIARLPGDDPTLESDRRQAARATCWRIIPSARIVDSWPDPHRHAGECRYPRFFKLRAAKFVDTGIRRHDPGGRPVHQWLGPLV